MKIQGVWGQLVVAFWTKLQEGVHYFMSYCIFISIFVKMCLGSRGGPGGPIHPLCASVHFCEQELDWELWSLGKSEHIFWRKN